jgi:hypothetical protein
MPIDAFIAAVRRAVVAWSVIVVSRRRGAPADENRRPRPTSAEKLGRPRERELPQRRLELVVRNEAAGVGVEPRRLGGGAERGAELHGERRRPAGAPRRTSYDLRILVAARRLFSHAAISRQIERRASAEAARRSSRRA